jgi:hypothetical protein
MPAPNSMVRRLLSFWGPNVPGPNTTPMAPPINTAANGTNILRGPSGSNGDPCWWTVEVNAQEVGRQIPALAPPVSPLRYAQIQEGLPCSKLWAEVGWFREGIGRRCVMDIGPGQRMSVNACNVQVNIIHPPQAVTIRGEPGYNTHAGATPATFPTLDAGPGLYLDTVLRASVVCSCAPSSFRGILLTQTLIVPPGTTWQQPCPPGAIGIDLYVPGGTAGGLFLAGFWTEFLDPTGSSPPTGLLATLPFSAISTDRTGLLDRPGNAAGVAGTNTTAGPLAYTFVWHLEF